MFRSLVLIVTVLVMSACASTPQTRALLEDPPQALQSPLIIDQVPFFPQDDYQCGPAALATVLVASGIDTRPEQLVPLVYVPERRGSFQIEIVAAARSFGRLVYPLAPTLDDLFAEIAAGNPVLVMQNLALDWYPQWHFAVVKGVDLERRKVILNSGRIEDYEQALPVFERTWARADHWAIVVIPPGELPVTASARPYMNALLALEQTQPAQLVAPAYTAGLQRWPEDTELLMAQGNFFYTQDDLEAASAVFAQVNQLSPTYAPAWNNRAQILHEQGDSAAALEYVARAIELGGPFLPSYEKTRQMIEAGLQGSAEN